MTEKFEKTKHLPVTPSGPKPGDFPIGSPESRAAARSLLDRGIEQEVETRIVHHFPNNSAQEEPVGEAVLEGKPYEVYGGNVECLYPKIGTRPLPRVRLARASIIIHVRRVE